MSLSSLTPEQVSYCDWLFGQWAERGFDEMIISLNSHLFPESQVNASQLVTDSRRAMKNYLLQKILLFFPGEFNRLQG